ncbi:hypothetical protein DRO64_04340 [Candidatus Bathyarchaeota archaeon]|nr:MAG: hypothetical protein DRO64_04340 [Candidatus Bathyarchaeota archaeon]
MTATGQYKRLMSTRRACPSKEEFKRWIEIQSLEVIARSYAAWQFWRRLKFTCSGVAILFDSR